MPRYKAIFEPGQDIRSVREVIHTHGARGLYFADKEEALFFETDAAEIVTAVRNTAGVNNVYMVGE